MGEIKVIEVPKWGLTMDEGMLTTWLVTEGSDFRKGDELCEVETSKIANAVEASFDGTLRRILAQSGETLPVGAPIGLAAPLSVTEEELDEFISTRLDVRSEEPYVPASNVEVADASSIELPVATQEPSLTGIGSMPDTLQSSEDDSGVFATSHARRLAHEHKINLNLIEGSGRGGRISVLDIEREVRRHGGDLPKRKSFKNSDQPQSSSGDDSEVAATPVARRLARKLGINLLDCRVSGSRGRVCRADVEAAQALRQLSVSGVLNRDVSEPPAQNLPEVVPMSGMRKAIASRLQSSKRNAPHFRLTVDLELDHLQKLRQEINEALTEVKVSVNDLLVKACAMALVKVPELNVQFDEQAQSIIRFTDADVAVAVSLPSGLVTPVVRVANKKSISEISGEVRSLATQAKAGTLRSEQMSGGTFTISNLGMLGIRQFDAIINPPQAAILAVGGCEPRAVVRDGSVVPRDMMTVSLSCDHRVIDGANGAGFLAELKRFVEAPALMMV